MTSKLILGTVQFGTNYGISNSLGKPTAEEGLSILRTAYNNGIQILDTAKAYGTATDIINKYHSIHKERFKIISKFHLNDKNLLYTLEADLEKLKIEKYEALLFHSFNDFAVADNMVFNNLRLFKRYKKVDKLGISVYNNAQFELAIKHNDIEVIQFPYNLLDNWCKRGSLIELAKKRGKELHVRSVFLQGLFFMNINQLPLKLIPLSPYLNKIHTIATENNVSIAEIAMAYVMQNRLIDRVLIGVISIEQLMQNISAGSSTIPNLIIEEINKINVQENNLLNPSLWN